MVLHIENWIIFFLVFLASLITHREIRGVAFILAGWGYIYYFYPPSLLILIPCTLLVITFFKHIFTRNFLLHKSLLFLAFLFVILSAEILTLWQGRLDIMPLAFNAFFINTLRYVHVYTCHKYILSEDDNVWTVMAYMWFPPLLFCGPLETFQEFREYHINRKPRMWLSGFKLMLSSLLKAVLVYIVYNSLVLVELDYAVSNLWHLLLRVGSMGFTVMLSLSAWFDLSRGWSHWMGYSFSKPNFHQLHRVKSVASFWTHYNISLSRWLKRHLFYRALTEFRLKDFSIAIVIYFAVIALLKNISTGFLIWGLLHGAAILINFLYIYLKVKFKKLMILDAHYFPNSVKTLVTYFFILFTWSLWYPDWYILYSEIFNRLSF